MPDFLQPIFEWLDSFSALVFILVIIAILYLIRMLWRGAKKALPGLKAAITFVEALFQLPAFMAATTKSINEVRHEVLPNEGGSLRDDLETATLISEKLDLRLDDMSQRLSQVEQHDQSDHERIQALEEMSRLEDTITRRREQRAVKQQEYRVATGDTPAVTPYPQDMTEE